MKPLTETMPAITQPTIRRVKPELGLASAHAELSANGAEEQAPASSRKGVGGRPRKYTGPSRPITLTLPDSTLDGLKMVHPDRGQAIVKLTEAALRRGESDKPRVELVEMANSTGLLIVSPSAVLRRIKFLHLVEVSPARYMLAMDPGNDFRSLELALRDELENLPAEDEGEKGLILELLERITVLRKSSRVRMAEILFVEMAQKGKNAVHSLMHTLGWLVTATA